MPAVLRGTALGSVLGVLPGGGAILASFAAYTLEKRVSSTPERFGKGAIQGVAGPESANNAAAQTSFIPMLTLGIPPNPVMALMIGAMVVMGITPGPKVMSDNPQLFWGLIASMWIGNLMLIVLNLPFVGIWVKLLTLPYRFLFPSIVCFCVIGLYTLSNNNFDIYLAGLFAAIGFAFIKLRCEAGPLLLGMVLGFLVTLTSVGAGALGVTALLLLYPKVHINRIVGTDVAHAVPLTLVAGIGHASLGTVDYGLLGTLLIGSIPGIWIGSHMTGVVGESWVRNALALILVYVGQKLAFPELNQFLGLGILLIVVLFKFTTEKRNQKPTAVEE